MSSYAGVLGSAVGVGGVSSTSHVAAPPRRGSHRRHCRRGGGGGGGGSGRVTVAGAARITAAHTSHRRAGVSSTGRGASDGSRGRGGSDAAAGGVRWTATTGAGTRGAVRCRGFFSNLFGGDKKKSEDEGAEEASSEGEKSSSSSSSSSDEPSSSAAAAAAATEEKSAAAAAVPDEEPTYVMPKTDFNSTMSALDALLPPDEEAEKRKAQDEADEARAAKIAEERKKKSSDEEESGAEVSVSISPAALKALQDAERARKDGGGSVPKGMDTFDGKGLAEDDAAGAEKKKKMTMMDDDKDAWLNQVVDGMSDAASRDRDERSPEENAKLDKVLADLSDLAKLDKDERSGEEIKEKFDSLFEILEITDEPAVPKEDLQKLKDEVFGYNTFWVTGTEELGPEIMGEGVLIKGNLRADRAEVWKKVQESVERLFDGKYTPFMLEEPGGIFGDDDATSASMSGSYDASDPSGSRGPRVSFLIVPSDKAGPNPQTSAFQYLVAIALFGLTAGSALQLGLVAEVSRLPQATMDWLAAGSQGIETNLAPGELPPGLEGFDSVAYVEGAFPILGGIFATAAAHEIGHMIAGAATNIKTSIPFLIPNGQLGSFGTVTQIKSLPKNRQDLFDVAFAGPLAGSLVSGAMFAYGLVLSAGGTGDELLPIPAELFQGSLLLGAISELVLGDTGEAAKGVLVHPLFIAGWCGLVTQALNSLPVGQIDGGRITQMGFGRRALGLTSLGVYLGLSLGVIGSSLSLSWALYVLICQRTPEFSPQDDVTEVSENRQQAALMLILISLLILLPGATAGAGDVMPML